MFGVGVGASIGVMILLAAVLVRPLLGIGVRPLNRRERWYAFAIYWFVTSAIFNPVWQLPLIVFREWIVDVDRTADNLLARIGWWGYGYADSHYGTVDNWMRSEKYWWLLATVIGVASVIVATRSRGPLGYLLMGSAGSCSPTTPRSTWSTTFPAACRTSPSAMPPPRFSIGVQSAVGRCVACRRHMVPDPRLRRYR